MSNLPEGIRPIHGDFHNQHLVSMHQLNKDDIAFLLDEAAAAENTLRQPGQRGISLLPREHMKAVMRQPSTRTGGSMATGMSKLGGNTQVISGMEASSESKGESREDSWVAFATQADIIGTRTEEDTGVVQAVHAIEAARRNGTLWQHVPVINLGDGQNEHPTQTIGDLYTMQKEFPDGLEGLTVTIVGDHERYRGTHSLMIAAAELGIKILAVESEVIHVPDIYVELLGDNLTTTTDLDEAMAVTDVLMMGRNPDEYQGKSRQEKRRSRALAHNFASWRVDLARIQKMKPEAIIMHPRPRRDELAPDVDGDPRARDIQQMANMIPARMAIIAALMGRSIQATR